jgi:hypothetical protein
VKKKTRAKKAAPDVLAREGAVGQRLRRLEEQLGLGEPVKAISATIVLCWSPDKDSPDRTVLAPDGTAHGYYRLGDWRECVIWGPRGLPLRQAERMHQRHVKQVLKDNPEYLEPLPDLARPKADGELTIGPIRFTRDIPAPNLITTS